MRKYPKTRVIKLYQGGVNALVNGERHCFNLTQIGIIVENFTNLGRVSTATLSDS